VSDTRRQLDVQSNQSPQPPRAGSLATTTKGSNAPNDSGVNRRRFLVRSWQEVLRARRRADRLNRH